MQATLNILVVEDNPINQLIATRLLEKAGHSVRLADNGRVALEILRDQGFDLVLMDLSMPEMDGFTATRLIRERETGTSQRLPIVAFTANTLQGERERCAQVGMDGFVSKPVDPATLLQVIAEALVRSRPTEGLNETA